MSKQLCNVPNGSRVRIVEEATTPPDCPNLPAGTEFKFSRIDGMYSTCFTDDGERVHLAAWTEVEVIT
jgi:hypothetical protein